MKISTTSWVHRVIVTVALLCGMVLAGCGGGSGSQTGGGGSTFTQPPAPKTSAYAVVTSDYALTHPGFSSAWQFVSDNYPIPVSYELQTVTPTDFDVVRDTEDSIGSWWLHGDPRVCIISGVPMAQSRIHIVIEKTVVYNGQSNIIGLTTVQTNGAPAFKVEVATGYTLSDGTYRQMYTYEIAKTLMHELGHAFGLGHSPDPRDVMYYQSNANQGTGYDNYITYGDASSLWTTLNTQQINWDSSRPAVTQPAQPMVSRTTTAPAMQTRSGIVVDVYTRQ